MIQLPLALAVLLAVKPADPSQAAAEQASPQLGQAWADLFVKTNAREAAKLADAVLAGEPASRQALALSYLAHWMLDDEALANRRFLDLAVLGGPSAGAFLLDGWGRLHTSEEEGRRVTAIARRLLPAAGALRGPIADLGCRTAEMAGDMAAVRELAAPLGWITRWRLIGPFENDQNSGYDVAYPPERGVDLSARYPGKQAEVSWRLVLGAEPDGRICLDCLLYPSTWGVAYLATWVRSDRARDAIVRAEADDHLKVWVNGRQAIADDTARALASEQHVAAVRLHAGWNQLLVKVAQRWGEWTLGLRLTDANGAALTGLTVSPDAHRFAPADADERWPAAPKDAFDQALAAEHDLAVPAAYLAAWRLFDEGYYRRARAAFEALHAASPGAAVYELGAAVSALGDEDRDHGLSGLAAASRLDATFARARIQRALVYLDMGLTERAEEQAQAALAINPSDPLALDVLARLRAGRQYWIAEQKLLDREEEAHPGLAAVSSRKAEAKAAQGLPLVALDLWRDAHARDAAGWAATDGLARLYESLGRPDRARGVLEERLLLRPQSVNLRLQLARLAAAYGRDAEARRRIAEVEELNPQSDGPYRVAGYLAERAGELPAAIAAYGQALARDPSDARLRDHVEILRPPGGDEKRYEVSHEEILRRAAAVCPEDYPGADAVGLLDQEIVRLNDDGSARHFVHRAWKIFDQVGADRHLNQWVGMPANFKLLYAGTIDPDGLERESSSRDGGELHLPAPSPGAVVEVRWSYDQARDSATADDFWEEFSFGGVDPAKEVEWVVLVPAGKTLHVDKRGAAVTEREEKLGPMEARIFEAKDLPRIDPEPLMPPWVDVQDVVFVSTLPTWDRVATFVHAVVDDQVIEDASVRAEAKRLTAGKSGPEDEVAALAAFVQKEIRYNMADTSLYSWRPHPARRVLASRYGDCKDKATLFVALAREVGLRAEFAVLKTRNVGVVTPRVPVTWYNHAIAYLPAQKGIARPRFIDLTADDLGDSTLPYADQAVQAMIIDPGKPGWRFMETPLSPPAENSTVTRSAVTLAVDGSARARVSLTARGIAAGVIRQSWRDPTIRRRVLDELAGRWLFQGGVPLRGSGGVRGLDDPDGPLTLDLGVAASSVLHREGDALLFKAGGFPQTQAYTQLATRTLPLELNAEAEQEVDWEYRLPPGVGVAQLPADVHLDNRFFSFTATYRQESGKVLLDTLYRTKAIEVAAADYPELRSAFLALARAADREIVLHAPPAKAPMR